jgi:ribosomal-protein-alanine N-acetyltransferase
MWSRRSQVKADVPVVAPANVAGATLIGRRLVLRPLVAADFDQWREVRLRCEDWLTKWEPARIEGAPDTVGDRQAFAARCGARTREIQMGSGYGFGMFVDGFFAGEININSVHRGPFQSAYVGYWIDERHAGHNYTPEAVALVLRFAFEQMMLHRIQISIIPRNQASRRVAEKLELRNEGVAERYLEINGVWEDHVRYAITSEEWAVRRDEIMAGWAY